MLNAKRILKDYEASGALNSLIGVNTAVADGVFTTKGGALVMILRVSGPEHDCLDAAQTDHLARRFESILRSLDDRFRLYQYFLKRETPLLPHRSYALPVVQEAIDARLRYLQSKPDSLYALDTYWAITFEGWRTALDRKKRLGRWLTHPQETIRESLSADQNTVALQKELTDAIEAFHNKVASLVVQLRDFIDANVLDTQQAFKVLRRLLNYAPYKADSVRLKHESFVDFQACDSGLECHRDYLRLDDYYVQVLTLKEPPGQTFSSMLSGLMELPVNCVVASEWKSETVARARQLIQSKRRHFFNSKASLMNYANSNSSSAPTDMLIDEGAAALVGHLGSSLQEIEVHGRTFGQFSLTVVLYHQDLAQLRRVVAQCFKIFATHDAQLTEESYNRLNAWLAVLPGNSAHNLRRLWLLNSNYADLSFLCRPGSGQVTNDHLGSEYLAILEGSGNTPYFLNLHYKDVGHTLVLGATGSGKSFLVNFLLTNLQKYEPDTCIFDLGGSYEALTQLFNGAYLPIGRQRTSVTINPFCLPPTKENLLFLFSFVKVLVESNGFRASAEDDQDLYEQIENLYAVPPEQRRLLTLSNIVRRNLQRQLQKWVTGGPYGTLFDNTEDSMTLSRFQTFDFEGMEKLPDQLEPLIFYILHRATARICDEDHLSGLKVFVIDEAWRFFQHPVIKAYIVEALKTWRKKNAMMILATQSSEDLLASDLLSVLTESCPTKLFLANPGMDRDAYRAAFHLNETEADMIARLTPKRQFLFKQPDAAKLLNLNVDRKEYWIYTNHPAENQRKRRAFAQYGFRQGLEVLTKEIA